MFVRLLFVFCLASPLVNAAVLYDFETGLEGWSNFMTSSTPGGPTQYSSQDDPYGTVGEPGRLDAYHGSYFLAPDPFSGRDESHQTLVLRSPEFRILDDGSISAYICAGAGSGNAPANVAALPDDSYSTGYLGLALRRTSDDSYVLAFNKPDNNDSWQHVSLSSGDVSPYVSQTETYTLDLIDYDSGGWGWTAIDYVYIESGTLADAVPEPTSIALLTFACATLVVLRRKAVSARSNAE